MFIVLSGPSGVGKDALLNELKKSGYPLKFVVTATTRPRRSIETDGKDYHFVSKEKFKEMIQQSELLEYANVYGHWYGVPKSEVRDALAKSHDVIVKVDVQGAASIKKIVPNAVFVFLMPPSQEALTERLKNRHTESPQQLEVRLRKATEEMEKLPEFDYVVYNHEDAIRQAVEDLKAIVAAEKCRTNPREIRL